MNWLRILAAGILGPAVALIVTWKPAVDITRIDGGTTPAPDIITRSRSAPSDITLDEIRDVSVGAFGLGNYTDTQIIAAADLAIEGQISIDGEWYDASVPAGGFNAIFSESIRNLKYCSLIVPNLLISAFELTDDSRYLKEAVDYVLTWSSFESSLPVASGYVFNDHATAARAIVVSEVWRHYRDSALFDAPKASQLLLYAKKLSHLLQDDRLYEYRTNHGIMQSLSLLHLGIAFPLLSVADDNLETGKSRLLSQLGYYVNAEGVILEHSAGYHQNGLVRLAAAWRYLGMLEEPVPDEFVDRYRSALEFRRALRRPDGTFPPIGDTVARPYEAIQVAIFDRDAVVSTPLRDEPDELPVPKPVTTAPGAGWIVLWDGLSYWPNSSRLTQTALHWGNFPTGAHKHADELSISLWSHGVQWVRGVGYWPYGRSRVDAIGWRSSNAPHWLNESSSHERQSRLVGTVFNDRLAFVEVLRANRDGSRIRRQLVKISENTWVVLDSFKSQNPRTAEIIWRLPAKISVEESANGTLFLNSTEMPYRMSMQLDSLGPITVDTDTSGTAPWNSGLMVDGELTASPAIRMLSSTSTQVMLTVFAFGDGTGKQPVHDHVELQWIDESNWQVLLPTPAGSRLAVRRASNVIRMLNGQSISAEFSISTAIAKSAAAPGKAALAALDKVSRHYGVPFDPIIERRAKVTLAIVVAVIAQFIVFLFVWHKQRKRWLPLTIVSLAGWIGLSLYLGTAYLV